MLTEPPSKRKTIVEGSEIVTDGLEIGQAILAHACAFWSRSHQRPASVGLTKRLSPHQSPAPGFGEKNWNLPTPALAGPRASSPRLVPVMTALSIIDVMDAPNGFQPWFEGESWNAWKTVLKAAFALPMTPQELIMFGELAGGRAPPKRRVRQLFVISGRRAGKDSVAALLAVHAATFEQGHLGKLRPGETAHFALIAVDRDQAGVLSSYIRSYFRQIPDLARMVTRQTRSGLELNNGVVISVQTNSFRQARGRTVLLCVLDELAFYRDENSQTPDIELHRAIMPSLMTLPNSMLIGISTPYRKAGLLYQMWRDHFGKDSDSVLVVQARSEQLNPLLDPVMVEEERQADPAAAVSEWDGRFREDLSSYVSIELIESAVDSGVHVRPPRAEFSYVGFVNSATGVGTDSSLPALPTKTGNSSTSSMRSRRPSLPRLRSLRSRLCSPPTESTRRPVTSSAPALRSSCSRSTASSTSTVSLTVRRSILRRCPCFRPVELGSSTIRSWCGSSRLSRGRRRRSAVTSSTTLRAIEITMTPAIVAQAPLRCVRPPATTLSESL